MSNQHERRSKIYKRGFIAGHTSGSIDICEMLLTAWEAEPDGTVEDVMGAVKQILTTLKPESTDAAPEESLIVVPGGGLNGE